MILKKSRGTKVVRVSKTKPTRNIGERFKSWNFTAAMGETRFFVGNVPQNTSEQELQSEFGFYGVVKSVEIKQKAEDEHFAFVNIQIEERLVDKCEISLIHCQLSSTNHNFVSFRHSRVWSAAVQGPVFVRLESEGKFPRETQTRTWRRSSSEVFATRNFHWLQTRQWLLQRNLSTAAKNREGSF